MRLLRNFFPPQFPTGAALLTAVYLNGRYLLAVCAKKLGKLKEAEMALQGGNFGAEGAPHEAYAYELMGQICK